MMRRTSWRGREHVGVHGSSRSFNSDVRTWNAFPFQRVSNSESYFVSESIGGRDREVVSRDSGK